MILATLLEILENQLGRNKIKRPSRILLSTNFVKELMLTTN
jgi:hypothetical protein